MVNILKEYGIYYVEIDLKTGEKKEYIKGSYEDVLEAFAEIFKAGLFYL